MRITHMGLGNVHLIEPEQVSDERGFFARVFCKEELEHYGLSGDIKQINMSHNIRAGTLRGLHSQAGDDAEDKIVACISGEIFDVCVDVRGDSISFGRWYGTRLSAENRLALYVPKGFAHGYLTMTDNASVLYYVTQFYKPGAERGYRYDDPTFGIQWPFPPPYTISVKDGAWPYVTR